MDKNLSNISFVNKVIDKSELKKLITWAFRNYGIARAANMADQLKDLGFHYATKAGISLSLEDLRIPPSKQTLLNSTFNSIKVTDQRYKRGEITAVERFQKVIDTWHYASDNLKQDVIDYFRETDPLNAIYMMAFSGARANISQVKQLVGMRGLMADPQGQIIDLPIFHNFREGLTITDYFISSYGARKGLVDTALRTADSGYLTRRLVDVAQDVIVREYDCNTSHGLLIEEMVDKGKVLISMQQSLLGRTLAEDIIDYRNGSIIAKSNQNLSIELVEKISKAKICNVLIRSPLTCSLTRSVCQMCYGWNLAHGKLVDLGEAVGIIAAQSIGEPGTQLTMRTFHTGGVFTGELSTNLVCDCSGTIKYPDNISLTPSRNRYGDSVRLANSDFILNVVNDVNKSKQFFVLKNSLVFVDNMQYVHKGSILAEYPNNKKMLTEKAQKTVVADFSGSVHFSSVNNNNPNENVIIWVLSGEVCNLPTSTNLRIKQNQNIYRDTLLARTDLLNYKSGKVYIIKDKSKLPKILLVTSSKLYTNIKVFTEPVYEYKRYFIETEMKDKFLLKCQPNRKVLHQQVIGDLVSNAYKTNTGGIIKYLDLYVSKSNEQDFYDIHGSGYILWIPEETHIVNKDVSLLLTLNFTFIESGTEIIQNVFSNNSGFLEVVEKDGIIREVVIKPGKLIPIKLNKIKLDKHRGFLRPGETFLSQVKTDKLVYWEYINISDQHFILLRPVIIYSLPNKNLLLKFSNNSFSTDTVNLRLVRRTYFRDGERIKSVAGVNLVLTHLIVELSNSNDSTKCYMQFYSNNEISSNSYFLIKFITADFLTIKDSLFGKKNKLYAKTSILVTEGSYVKSKSVVAQTDICSLVAGKVNFIEETKNSSRRILIVSNKDILRVEKQIKQNPKVKVNTYVYSGDEIADDIITKVSGQVIDVQNHYISIRIGQPYLISHGSLVHVSNSSLIQRGENIATLIFERLKTGDIVQGLPRIEEILEARKKIDDSFNPHFILENKFRSYLNQGLSIYVASRLSIMEIQMLLVKEVQSVYQSQGVYIADKHIEVIVKQMTSKVKIEIGGDTNYLPGELVDIQRVESINNSLQSYNKAIATYYPVLLGITKASLNTDSFISAASFQETTKVLTEAAMYGKIDKLRGLKENVIIGRLIPAGTGFNIYQSASPSSHNDFRYNNSSETAYDNISYNRIQNSDNFEDIIIDDRLKKGL